MSDKKVAYYPFSAINYFMLDEFRSEVITTVLRNLRTLPKKHKAAVDKATRRYVRVDGFRNSARAPLSLKRLQIAQAFEKEANLVAVILSAWAESNPDLRDQVFDILEARGWEVMPVDADRTRLPGFLPDWPGSDDFDDLFAAYQEKYPESETPYNDVNLMVVWLSGRLPVDKEEANGDAEQAPE